MNNDLRDIVGNNGVQFPFEESLSLLEKLNFVYTRFLERFIYFRPWEANAIEMRNRYSCKSHPQELLAPFKLHESADEWYLHGRCKDNPDFTYQISRAPNSFGLEWLI